MGKTSENASKILDDIYGESLSLFEQSEYRQRLQNLLRKDNSNQSKFVERIASLPLSAFIKCEYTKCGKPNCDQEHGPYYYSYWKDKKTKKLRKKYLGRL
ncbi:MAG: hypothetical protein R2685_06100 [Candidatus Nitrosocosmicus sp.]|nr:hypothetical protein [Candidatus Nitrosocosmicus sp.]